MSDFELSCIPTEVREVVETVTEYFRKKANNKAELFDLCSSSNPKLNDCLRISIENGIKKIGSEGIPALNVSPIEPLSVKNVVFDSANTSVKLDLKFSDVHVWGLSNITVIQADYDKEKNIFSFVSRHPRILQVGKYSVKGKVMILSVVGEGNSVVTLVDDVITSTVQLKEENGTQCIRVKRFGAKLKPARLIMDFENLFNGEKLLADAVLDTLNENWDIIYGDLENDINKAYSTLLEAEAIKLFKNVCLNKLFIP